MTSSTQQQKTKMLVMILCLTATLQLFTIRPGLAGGEDSALYLSHARNIALHRPYLDTGYIYSIETARYSPSGYPPIFPTMLAPIFRFWGLDLRPYKVLMAFIVVLCILAIALLYWDDLSPAWLCLLLLLIGFNPYIAELKNEMLSDLPFLLFLTLSFWFFRDRDLNAGSNRPLIRGMAAGLLSYLAYGTRAIGVGLIACAVAMALVNYRRLGRLTVPATVIFVIFATVQATVVSINSDYLRIAMFKGHSALQNLHFYIGVTSAMWDAGLGKVFHLLVFVTVTSISLFGAVSKWHKLYNLPTVFATCYATFLVVSPYHQARYIVPLLPIYFYYMVHGIAGLTRFASKYSRIGATVTAAILISALMGAYVGKYFMSDFGPSPNAWDSTAARELYSLVRISTPPDSVIVAHAPRALALYTDRKAAQFPDNLNEQRLARYIADVRATHILVPRTTADWWASLCGPACAAKPVFMSPAFVLYKTKEASTHELSNNSADRPLY